MVFLISLLYAGVYIGAVICSLRVPRWESMAADADLSESASLVKKCKVKAAAVAGTIMASLVVCMYSNFIPNQQMYAG